MHMRRVVHGIKRLVGLQLKKVTWKCSSTLETTDVQMILNKKINFN